MKLLLLGVAIGLVAYVLRQPARRETVPDDVLVTRVRLTGPVAAGEVRNVMRALRGLPGVLGLDCRLTPHA